MKEMPKNITAVAEKYKLNPESDFWTIGDNWIITHDAVTKIAEIENVEFDEPKVEIIHDTEAFYGVAMWGKGRIIRIDEDGNDFTKEVWTTADATRDNVRGKGGYYFNMCEKRWQDRLVLKLLNLYEYGLYSDVEADDFKKGQSKEKPMSDYMKNTIRQLLVAKKEYRREETEAIFQSLNAEQGKEWRDRIQSPEIDKWIVEFYKLNKKES
tara:strand:- start:16971 stop:17603 length:633 start_codon:yes stop_codon:yes gene_type:complete